MQISLIEHNEYCFTEAIVVDRFIILKANLYQITIVIYKNWIGILSSNNRVSSAFDFLKSADQKVSKLIRV